MKNIKKSLILATNYIHKGEPSACRVAGFFYAYRLKSGLVPPCDALMRSLPLWCSSTGQAKPFLFSLNLILFKMNYKKENPTPASPEHLLFCISNFLTLSEDLGISPKDDIGQMFYLAYRSIPEDKRKRFSLSYSLINTLLKELEFYNEN